MSMFGTPVRVCGDCKQPIPTTPELFVKGKPWALCKHCWLAALPKP